MVDGWSWGVASKSQVVGLEVDCWACVGPFGVVLRRWKPHSVGLLPSLYATQCRVSVDVSMSTLGLLKALLTGGISVL